MNGKKKILLASMAVLLTLTVQGQVLPYNVSLLNDLKTAYHHGDQAASEAVGNSKYLHAARKIGLSRGNKKIQNILYYQLIKK